jgi:hypothetical protein
MIFGPSFYLVSQQSFSTFIYTFFSHFTSYKKYRKLCLVQIEISDGPETPRRNEFCPFDFFDGEIKFDYFHNDEKICGQYESTISQCPSSSYLNVRYKSCNQPTFSTKYECIGHWKTSNKNYVALVEWSNGNATKARYKCGVS